MTEQSIFQKCKIQCDDDGSWWLVSDYWKIAMKDERSAKKTLEIVRAAFNHGAHSARAQIREALGIVLDD